MTRERRGLGKKNLLGGRTPLDPADEDVQLYLSEALAHINAGEEPDYK